MKENMFYGASPSIFQKAEELRNRMTPAEEMLWNAVRINEWKMKFRRQHPVANYVVDFYCHRAKLVIELDGGIHEVEEVKRSDQERENHLRALGLKVLRFKNEYILSNLSSVLEKIAETIRTIQLPPLGDGGMKLSVIKIGGKIIDDEAKLSSFLSEFAGIEGKKMLVHGGGNLATKLAEQLRIPQKVVDGRRITDEETLKIVTMVYAGYVNKNIVAKLQASHCNAMGLCGTDGDLILAHKRQHPLMDYGFVGDIDAINAILLKSLLNQNISIVIAPITHDQKGQLLNTNADTIAHEVAKAMSSLYDTCLIYTFEKAGVLLDAENDLTVIPKIDPVYYRKLRTEQKIFAGMIPKLDNAFAALSNGVKRVMIGKAENLKAVMAGTSGTTIVNG